MKSTSKYEILKCTTSTKIYTAPSHPKPLAAKNRIIVKVHGHAFWHKYLEYLDLANSPFYLPKKVFKKSHRRWRVILRAQISMAWPCTKMFFDFWTWHILLIDLKLQITRIWKMCKKFLFEPVFWFRIFIWVV